MRNIVILLWFLVLATVSTLAFAQNLETGLAAAKEGDFNTAIRHFAPLAQKGDTVAQYYLGIVYFNDGSYFNDNYDYSSDREQAFKWLTKSAKGGHADAQKYLADKLDITGDEKGALRWYRKAADQNHPVAQFILAEKHVRSILGLDNVNYSKAMPLYIKSAQNGYVDAQMQLGTIYLLGIGNDQINYSPVNKEYRLISTRSYNIAESKGLVGKLGKKKNHVQQRFEEAAKWYLKAAEQGNVDAQYNLAIMYESGDGVIQNDAEANKWFWEAVKNNDVKAEGKIKFTDVMTCYFGPPLSGEVSFFANNEIEGGSVFVSDGNRRKKATESMQNTENRLQYNALAGSIHFNLDFENLIAVARIDETAAWALGVSSKEQAGECRKQN